MGRVSTLLLALAACGSEPTRHEDERPSEKIKIDHDEYSAYHISREGTVSFVGYFEPVATLDEVYIQYVWRFRCSAAHNPKPEPALLYVDDRKSGLRIGDWAKKLCTAVGRLKQDQVVGHERTPGSDTKKPVMGHLLELVAIDTYSGN